MHSKITRQQFYYRDKIFIVCYNILKLKYKNMFSMQICLLRLMLYKLLFKFEFYHALKSWNVKNNLGRAYNGIKFVFEYLTSKSQKRIDVALILNWNLVCANFDLNASLFLYLHLGRLFHLPNLLCYPRKNIYSVPIFL